MDDQHDYRGWDLWLENNKVATHLVNKWPENALKVVARGEIPMNTWTHVFVTYDGSSQAAGVKIYINGEPQATDIAANQLNNTIRTSVPLKVGQRHTGVPARRGRDQRRPDPSPGPLAGGGRGARRRQPRPAPRGQAARTSDPRRDRASPLAWWLKTRDPSAKELQARFRALEQEEAAIRPAGSIAHVMQERSEPAMAYVLYRGEYDKRRDPVKPDTPDVLPPMPGDLPRNRLGLAQWLLRPEHPLTARVTVNRFWQEVFGTGLVRTAGDFGVSGELPSHPELLDWLAVEFRESGWDVKRFFKLLVTSAAYRQSAETTPEKVEKDPQNRLLSRGPRFRMDARDDPRSMPWPPSGLLAASWAGRASSPTSPTASGTPWPCPRATRGTTAATTARGSIAAASTRSGSGAPRRPRWRSSTPPAARSAPSAASGPTRRSRPWSRSTIPSSSRRPGAWPSSRSTQAGRADEGRIDFMARRLLARPLRPEELRSSGPPSSG